MSTLLIAGGTLVDERSARRADLLIDGEKVSEVLEPGLGRSADRTLDATGLHVLPGMVDAHVHFNEPGRTDWEGFRTGTLAAAAGGVTTVCDMPLNSHPPTLDARAHTLKLSAIAEHACVDYALWGGVVPESLEHVGELARARVVGLKAFLCDSGLTEYAPLDEFALLEAMQRCAEHRLLLALHAEDAAETHRRGAAARANGQDGPLDWAHSRPPETEIDAVEGALRLAADVAGVRLHFVHISTAGAVERIVEARGNGMDVSVETCPHYLLLDESDLVRLGAFGKCAPPLRTRGQVDALWSAVLDGSIDFIASDHSPCPPTMKQTDSIWSAWGGLHGVQTSLVAMLTEGVASGIDLPAVVRLVSANPARRLGLYPRKGALAPGSDADVALVDLNADWTLGEGDLQTRWRVSPYLGRSFTARVAATLVRGTLVWQDGAPRVAPGFGRHLEPGIG